MSTRIGQPRIKGNTTYYRLSTDAEETPVRLHDDIAEIIDRLGPEECSVGKVEVRYINKNGLEKRAEILFDTDGQRRDVYRTWQYSQQSNREIPLWFFNVKYRGTKFRIKLDVPNQKMAVAVAARDEDMALFDEFMHSLEGKDDWSHRQPPHRGRDADDAYDGMRQPYHNDYDEDRLDGGEMADLVNDGYNQGGYDGYDQGGYDDGYGQGGYDDGYDQGYDQGGYDDGYDQGGYDDGYGQGGYDDGYNQGGYPPQGQSPAQRMMRQQGGSQPQPEGVEGDPFGKYFTLALVETIVTSLAGLALIILLNLETHLGISITSVIFCAILLVAPIISISALVRVSSAHKKIQEDYRKGIRAYEKAKKRMIVVLVLMIIWVVVLGYLGFMWYTHSLPPQLSGIYDLLDHKIG